jgi:hypothetical protein
MTLVASVISRDIIEDSVQGDGRREIRYRLVCEGNDAVQVELWPGNRRVPEDFVAQAALDAMDPLATLADTEDSGVFSAFEDNINPLDLVLNPLWSTSKRLAKELIYWMMEEKDPRIVIWLDPLLDYLDANFTNEALSNFLDMTIPQLAKMKVKSNAIMEEVDTVENNLVVFDANTEVVE